MEIETDSLQGRAVGSRVWMRRTMMMMSIALALEENRDGATTDGSSIAIDCSAARRERR
jgi:hypothetical protein